MLKFCLLPLQISSLELQYTAPYRSWRFCNTFSAPKNSGSLSVSSTIYVLRWFCSFGSLFQLRCSDGVERPAPSLFFLLKAICAVPTIWTTRTGYIFRHTIATFSKMWHLFILYIYIFFRSQGVLSRVNSIFVWRIYVLICVRMDSSINYW